MRPLPCPPATQSRRHHHAAGDESVSPQELLTAEEMRHSVFRSVARSPTSGPDRVLCVVGGEGFEPPTLWM